MADGVRYVIERLNWRRCDGFSPAGPRRPTFHRLPGETPVASFDSPAEAEAFCRAREAEARARVGNPFAGADCPPVDRTGMPDGVFRDWLRDHGIEPPAAPSPAGWVAWWDAESPGWTDAQRAAVWEALDGARFYRVAERPPRPVAYAVVRVLWGYNDEWFYPGAEGGQVTAAYRSRARAEAEAARLTAAAREEWAGTLGGSGMGANQFDLEDRRLPGQDPLDPPARPPEGRDEGDEDAGYMFGPDEVPFYEVVEIELEGGA